MHAAVKILVDEAQFSPQVALAVTRAMDVVIKDAQLVTIPVLDARLAELKAELKGDIKDLRSEMKDMKAELIRWVMLAMLGSTALAAATKAFLDL